VQTRKRSENERDEQRACHVEGHHQHPERADRANAEAAHRESHRAECAEGSKSHDHREDAEQDLSDAVGEREHRPPQLRIGIQRKAEQQREQQHWQHLALVEGAKHRLGDEAHCERDDATRMRVLHVLSEDTHVQMGGVDVHTRTGSQHEGRDKSERERCGSQKIKQRQRLKNRPADCLSARKRRDPRDDRAEDDRRNHHPHETNEPVAQGLE
jgi:hypothetical protein